MRNFIFFRFNMGLVDSILAKCKIFPRADCSRLYKKKHFQHFLMSCTKVKRCLIVKSGTVTIIVSDFATVVGYLSVSRPFLDLAHPRHMNSSHSELLEVHAY